jgi:hypothetical protein
MLKHAAMLFLLASAGSLLAQENVSKTLYDLTRFEGQLVTKARVANLRITDSPYREELARKAAELAAGIDVDKVDPEKSDECGKLFAKAQKHREAIVLFRRYLTTNQLAYRKDIVQRSILDSYYALGDGTSLRKEMEESGTTLDRTTSSILGSSLTKYFDLIAKVEGVDRALKSIDLCASRRLATDPKAYAQQTLKAVKDRESKRPPKTALKPGEQRLAEWEQSAKDRDARYRLETAMRKIKLLSDAGRTLEADAVLKEFASTPDLGSSLVKRAAVEREILALLGTKAPVMPVEKKYGGFEGFDALKGKVVLMDFYGPLWSAHRTKGLANAYADLKDKGLEILSLAPLRPYYDDRWDLTAHQLNVKRANVPWPAAYADSKEFQKAAPHLLGYLLVVDRKGNIRYIRNPDNFEGIEELRVKLQTLLSEK